LLMSAVEARYGSRGLGEQVNSAGFVRAWFAEAVARPAGFLIGQATSSGVGVVMALLCAMRVVGRVREMGVGFQLLLVTTAVLAIDPSARHLIHAMPSVLVLVGAVLVNVRWRDIVPIAVLQVILTRWYVPGTVTFGAPPGDGVSYSLLDEIHSYAGQAEIQWGPMRNWLGTVGASWGMRVEALLGILCVIGVAGGAWMYWVARRAGAETSPQRDDDRLD
jgi:hypothetical protein